MRRKIPDEEIEDLIAAIGSIALQIPDAYESTRLDEIDPDDNKFLAAVYEAKAECPWIIIYFPSKTSTVSKLERLLCFWNYLNLSRFVRSSLVE